MHLNLKIISINSLRVRSLFYRPFYVRSHSHLCAACRRCCCVEPSVHEPQQQRTSIYAYTKAICINNMLFFGFPLSSSQDPSGSSSCVVFYSIYIYTFGSLTYYHLNPLRSLSCTFIYIYLSCACHARTQ